MPIPDLSSAVETILRDVADEFIMPRWRQLAAHETQIKADQSLVTIADIAAEQALQQRLSQLLPGPTVVGEELAETNPAILDALARDEAVWIIDPVDGTRSFAEGSEDFGTMIALKYKGQLTHGWIYRPAQNIMLMGEVGVGATLNGEALRVGTAPRTLTDTAICMSYRFWPPHMRAPLISVLDDCGTQCDHINSNTTFWWLAQNRIQALVDPARRPWDVAPGVALYAAMGGQVKHVNGDAYTVRRGAGSLLYAPDIELWDVLAARLRQHIKD
jgi:fructose-1,6-bisphosphatase/inositol monophosphatase family enzyme